LVSRAKRYETSSLYQEREWEGGVKKEKKGGKLDVGEKDEGSPGS